MRACFMRLVPLAFFLSLGAASGTPVPAPVPPPPSVPAVDTAQPEADLTQIVAVPYNPQQKKDPFSVPTEVEKANRGDLVDDIGVKGRIVSNGKSMLVATDSRGNIRTLPVGYRFRDGELVSVTEYAVTFHQWEVTSTNKSVYRTIVKNFKKEEGKP